MLARQVFSKDDFMSQTQANLVEVRGIRFSRGDRVIFDDISLSVPRGKITAIMGPSGIGKTTLLRLIGGQIPPDRGEILFDGENVPQMTRSRLYTVRKRMSMLFQSGAPSHRKAQKALTSPHRVAPPLPASSSPSYAAAQAANAYVRAADRQRCQRH